LNSSKLPIVGSNMGPITQEKILEPNNTRKVKILVGPLVGWGVSDRGL